MEVLSSYKQLTCCHSNLLQNSLKFAGKMQLEMLLASAVLLLHLVCSISSDVVQVPSTINLNSYLEGSTSEVFWGYYLLLLSEVTGTTLGTPGDMATGETFWGILWSVAKRLPVSKEKFRSTSVGQHEPAWLSKLHTPRQAATTSRVRGCKPQVG